MSPPRLGPLLLLALAAVAAGSALARRAPDGFDHEEHAGLFPTCEGCHAGIRSGEGSAWPTAESCEACHDGQVEERVEWAPPVAQGSNLLFTHGGHAGVVHEELGADSTLACVACHAGESRDWMDVQRAAAEPCLACHGADQPHLELAGVECASCHVPLAQATRLADDRIRGFPAPPSHEATDFAMAGHGALAPGRGTAAGGVDQSCATCHAREYCLTCHVNAPEVASIQALGADPRSTLVPAELRAPASHDTPAFLARHGAQVAANPAACQTCHTQESCLSCHVGEPGVAQALYAAGPGRGVGAPTERRRPEAHGLDFSRVHAEDARTAPRTCATCHAVESCLDCHRPSAADGRLAVGPVDAIDRGYHPPAFLTRHPAAAYAQETACADCHNTAAFCTDCHAQAGLGASGPLRSGYHDGQQFFIVGHGQAARQSLESCVSCHTERDCLTCHSAFSGRGFNPHGPGFDADRLRRRNPTMCSACHGSAIPG